MAYPNRTHGISEGEGTREHLKCDFYKISERALPAGAR